LTDDPGLAQASFLIVTPTPIDDRRPDLGPLQVPAR
jgi:hypothetical protein